MVILGTPGRCIYNFDCISVHEFACLSYVVYLLFFSCVFVSQINKTKNKTKQINKFLTISCRLFGIIQPATATCPSRTGQPFHHGRCQICNQRSQEQEISWARWDPPRDFEKWWQTSANGAFPHIHDILEQTMSPGRFQRHQNHYSLYEQGRS